MRERLTPDPRTMGHVAQIFHIPEEEIPSDLDADSPQPDEWDKYLLSYYPFAASEAASEGTCPEPETLLNPQVLVLNMCAQDDSNAHTRPGHMRATS